MKTTRHYKAGRRFRLALTLKRRRLLLAAIITTLSLFLFGNRIVGLAFADSKGGAEVAQPGNVCANAGRWIDVSSRRKLQRVQVFDRLARKPIILLGETHNRGDHHRWQLHTLAGLLGRTDKIVIGFEMFPRRVQPVLDKWVNGELSAKAFLKEAEWRKVWGFDADLYLPLFEFARMHRIDMRALNVERSLISSVGAKGWKGVDDTKREGVSKPAPVSETYRRDLAEVFIRKEELGKASKAGKPLKQPGDISIDEEKLKATFVREEFQRFVGAQSTWDRAMAEALAAARRSSPEAVVVGIMGSGHVEHRHGVPHQLQDLGMDDVMTLIPVDAGGDCERMRSNFADLVFTLNSERDTSLRRKRMLLGVFIRTEKKSVIVDQVSPGSVAETSKLQKGDKILRAAGVDIRNAGELIEIISRQAPGTWLPLLIERDGKEIEVIAKFERKEKSKS